MPVITTRRRIAALLYDLRHPWSTFTREVALLHCRRTGQRLTPINPRSTYNIIVNNDVTAAAIAEAERRLAARRAGKQAAANFGRLG